MAGWVRWRRAMGEAAMVGRRGAANPWRTGEAAMVERRGAANLRRTSKAAMVGRRRAAMVGRRVVQRSQPCAVKGQHRSEAKMDRNSTYVLKINLLGSPKKARKDIKCFCFDKVIDSDLTNYKDLVESIVEQYSPCYLEVAHVQYYDDFLKIYPEVTSDQELVLMFEKHSKTKVVHMFVAYCDPSEPYEPITEWHSDAHSQPNNIEQDDDDDDDYLRNPVLENEHVGVDEENIYLEDEPIPLIMVPCSNKEKDKDYVPDHESEDGSEDESMSEVEVEEDEEYHEADHAPHFEYNKLDPPMNEGRKYPNMAEFKLALSQHAIKHEFEFDTEKSAPHRFRAYCSRRDEDKCPWRIYASTMEDECTVMVRKNPSGHDCSSKKRKKKLKNANKRWICEHVKD
ncbi:uncharacterized protein LOC125546831 [Triticum urartu]|uniref:uncharacterized protein LOC125546831 n=1 Tax=Triticum urartu TaxID=4572 RepID=UPI002044275F|nr:uncharacterized protein LOC125546831 [Triticum urartu]